MRLAKLLVLLIMNCVAIGALAQAPTAAPQRIRGDVVALDGLNLQVRSRAGDMYNVTLADNYTVTAVTKIGIDRIVTGTYIGTATMPQPDGTQKAIEILLFPEARRGAGEGHYPWDLQPGSMMTNATVASVVAAGQSRQMTLKYKDGEEVVVVPPDTPIVTFEPGERSMLVPGAHVMFSANKQPDGSLTAAGVNVGKNGLVPPM